jgi:hypothetical protein
MGHNMAASGSADGFARLSELAALPEHAAGVGDKESRPGSSSICVDISSEYLSATLDRPQDSPHVA